MLEFANPSWLFALAALALYAGFAVRRYVRIRRVRDATAAILRTLVCAAAFIALAGPLGPTASRKVDVVFALDVSHSIDRGSAAAAIDFVNRALEVKPADSEIGLVAFGSEAGVEALARDQARPFAELTVDIDRSRTDIARGLELALGTFTGSGHRRIVLMSDGQENQGRGHAIAAMARAVGVEVHALPLEAKSARDEIHMQGIVAPSRVRVFEPFKVEMLLHSRRRARAHLVMMRNGTVVEEVALELEPGANTYTRVEEGSQAGLYEYEAVINSDADDVQENNRFQAFVEVVGAPKVLHLVGQPGWGTYVTEALRGQGLTVDELPGDALPATLHGLTDYDLLILNNVSGFDVSLEKMRLIETYVRDAGGGLIALGGDKSYSGGGYYASPVERALPVSMDVKTQAQIPSLSVIIVLDRSGSMATDDKLYIAKSAALAAIEVLNPLDEVGVLTFDEAAEWSVPPTQVANRTVIADLLRQVSSGGGTDLYKALEEARDATQGQSAKVKHVIVLSDGLTKSEVDFEGLILEIAGNGATVSTVGFGGDADQALLESIAAWGNGRFYFTDNPENIPRIFTSETLVVSRNLHVEKRVQPVATFVGELLEGIDVKRLPALDGYQRTFPKPTAQILVRADGEDPLLVSWRYGLGKSVAFMSDLAGRWSKRWIDWEEFGRFMGQTARWSMRQRGGEKLLPSFSWKGDKGTVVADVLDRDDAFMNGLDMRATMVGPKREPIEIALEQVAPGRYRGQFPVRGPGRYYMSLRGDGTGALEGRRVGPRTFGLAIPYSPEYLARGADYDQLEAIARAGGGGLLSMTPQALDRLFAVEKESIAANARVWSPFVWLALVLLIVEIAVRKLRIPARVRSWLRLREAPPERASPEFEQLIEGLASARDAHLEALHQGRAYNDADPSARARLHMARAGQR